LCSSARFLNRRDVLQKIIGSTASALVLSSPCKEAIAMEPVQQTSLQNYMYGSDWQGTGLELLSYLEAANLSKENKLASTYAMGRWPDPILRRPASSIKIGWTENKRESYISDIANALRRTARKNGAVGLAAQQCGIDVSMIFLDDPKLLSSKVIFDSKKINEGGLFLVNPRIIDRSSELEMKVWNEECLVLPPTFRATVLRDAVVKVQYENLTGETNVIKLQGELARALQHELDHDRGIMILDHVGMNELENDDMRIIEQDGHNERQKQAYSRFISDPIENEKQSILVASREAVVLNANTGTESADEHAKTTVTDSRNVSETNLKPDISCDETCMQERKRIILERRALMQQSRTNRQRSSVLELSRQRAKLYDTPYQGASCPPGIPCI